MIGVPLSPLPEVKSQRLPSKSVSLLGVVPCEDWSATRFAFFSFISAFIAFLASSPDKSPIALSARYLSFNSLGVPTKPFVYAGDTTGSASSQIPPTGSLNAPSP